MIFFGLPYLVRETFLFLGGWRTEETLSLILLALLAGGQACETETACAEASTASLLQLGQVSGLQTQPGMHSLAVDGSRGPSV